MSRAEAGELRDVALDAMGVDLAQHRAQRGRRPVGMVAGRARLRWSARRTTGWRRRRRRPGRARRTAPRDGPWTWSLLWVGWPSHTRGTRAPCRACLPAHAPRNVRRYLTVRSAYWRGDSGPGGCRSGRSGRRPVQLQRLRLARLDAADLADVAGLVGLAPLSRSDAAFDGLTHGGAAIRRHPSTSSGKPAAATDMFDRERPADRRPRRRHRDDQRQGGRVRRRRPGPGPRRDGVPAARARARQAVQDPVAVVDATLAAIRAAAAPATRARASGPVVQRRHALARRPRRRRERAHPADHVGRHAGDRAGRAPAPRAPRAARPHRARRCIRWRR